MAAVAGAASGAASGAAAVVFDMDGLMIDSEPLWHIAERESFARVGIALSDADLLDTTGLRIDEVVQFNFDKFGGWDETNGGSGGGSISGGVGMTRAAVATAIVDRMEALLSQRAATLKKPGLDAALAFFQAKGLPLALASSSPMRLIRAALTGLGLLDGVFTVVVSAEKEKLGKPYPGVYLTACQGLGAPPTRCIALEDSLNGVLAAKAAKMKCIAVPEHFENRPLAFHIADVQLSSLEQVNDALWESLWS